MIRDEPRYARPAAGRTAKGIAAALVGAVGAAAAIVARDPNGAVETAAAAGAGAVLGTLAGLLWAHLLVAGRGRMRWRRDLVTVALWTCLAALAALAEAGRLPGAVLAGAGAAVLVPPARAAGTRAVLGASAVLAVAVGAAGRPVLAVGLAGAGGFLAVSPGPRWRSALRWAWPVFARTTGTAVVAGLAALALRGDPLAARGPWFEHPLVALLAATPAGLALGLALVPLYERLAGHAIRSQLFDLADVGHPLLERIATRAPGTWQHSRAMANLAEQAAHAIGADALLVRVGAYYHDLGKAEAPRFFVENLGPDEPNPHEALPPAESAARIVAHVRDGVRHGRAAGLPEDIVDFMHTHHGDGLVEYFWQKAKTDDPAADEAAFRYPGARPFSPETAILAVVDAVEAAARTLDRADRASVERLVRQILYGKLRAGQLDDADLRPADLRVIAETLVASLLASGHERVRYPWQESEPPPAPRLRPDASDGHVPPAADASATGLRVVEGPGAER